MTNQLNVWVVGVVALVIGGSVGYFARAPQPPPSVTAPSPAPEPPVAEERAASTPTPVAEPPVSDQNVIHITDRGFVHAAPGTEFVHRGPLTIKAKETVTWISKATAPVWPAGDPHPTHDAYPSTAYALPGDPAKSFGSNACVEYGIRKSAEVVDPCQLLLPEQTFTFRFTEKGSWGFHNHVRPEHRGTVIVE